MHQPNQPRLTRAFFARPSPVVARQLLGSWLVRRLGDDELRVRVCETEAYLGASDPASHAFRGRTGRNAVMFGPAGIAYVYFVYGMHHCFNVVTGQEGDPQAVLIRGGSHGSGTASAALGGPALLSRALGIDLSCNEVDLCRTEDGSIWFEAGGGGASPVLMTPRIGVRDRSPMRFVTVASTLRPSNLPRPRKSEPRRARSKH
ncbi:MAG: DNA-3-methyladenine glycosylase [Candidatus Dormiibacterota bacterium]